MAMAAAQYEGLIGAIEEHHALASEGVLAEARAMRERLHKKGAQESQKLRRKHAAEMKMQASLSKLSLLEVTQSPPVASSASAGAAPASEGPEAKNDVEAIAAAEAAEQAAKEAVGEATQDAHYGIITSMTTSRLIPPSTCRRPRAKSAQATSVACRPR